MIGSRRFRLPHRGRKCRTAVFSYKNWYVHHYQFRRGNMNPWNLSDDELKKTRRHLYC